MDIYCLAETREEINKWAVFRLHDNKWRWVCAKRSFRYEKLKKQGHHFFLPPRRFEFSGMYFVGEKELESVEFVEGDLS